MRDERHGTSAGRLSYVQTDATALNIVGPTMLRVVASLLAVAWKRMQELPRQRVVPHFSSGTVERGNMRRGERKLPNRAGIAAQSLLCH